MRAWCLDTWSPDVLRESAFMSKQRLHSCHWGILGVIIISRLHFVDKEHAVDLPRLPQL